MGGHTRTSPRSSGRMSGWPSVMGTWIPLGTGPKGMTLYQLNVIGARYFLKYNCIECRRINKTLLRSSFSSTIKENPVSSNIPSPKPTNGMQTELTIVYLANIVLQLLMMRTIGIWISRLKKVGRNGVVMRTQSQHTELVGNKMVLLLESSAQVYKLHIP